MGISVVEKRKTSQVLKTCEVWGKLGYPPPL
jgi:hypothetical protein